ncbi:hypothetical protein ARMGADRAFT_304937 [Armillaria gallica]|uniref:Heterokaryon incompatibility domain-containing protein n=1 Tax=Armillaria gallica TaxID=47427 RepID=A0A2H3D8K3_ARMGA|nr:hypothetical protein ARMGADRAFT_304937 [Armillaria gallica]
MGISVSNLDWGDLCQQISHAWMEEKGHVDLWTPIDGYDWPVLIPKDANLDLIHIEMLNFGAEYAWLDVLCLRQTGVGFAYRRVEAGCAYYWSSVLMFHLSGVLLEWAGTAFQFERG